jgi:exodeoxyribonuclease VIII
VQDFKNVMIDLETLGTVPGSVILSIGAVAFDEGQPESLWDQFEARPIKVRSSRAVGLTIDEGTLAWWMHQDAEARGLLDCALEGAGGLTVHEAMSEFSDWFPLDACIWGNGANFDEPLLTAAYSAIGRVPPYKYYVSHCYRTMKNLFRNVPTPAFQGLKHDALADALHQTRHLQAILLHTWVVR